MPSRKKRSKKILQAPSGMPDILPEDQVYWERVKKAIRHLAEIYRFQYLETPLLEEVVLFEKTGKGIVNEPGKEVFLLRTGKGNRLALRPELRGGLIRSYLENELFQKTSPVKLFTLGPVFRYEKSFKNWSQLFQANFEIVGEKDASADAQLIQMFFSLAKKNLGLKNLIVQISSIGCVKCRPNYRRALINSLRKSKKELCFNCQRDSLRNPLRVLSCKNPECFQIKERLPQIIDYLCEECRTHFKNVLEYLDELEIPYILNPYLIQEANYSTKTVFEVRPEEWEGLEISLGNGGRDDGLVKILGGQETPLVGFTLEVNRLVSLVKERKIKIASRKKPLVFLMQLGELGKKKSLKLFEQLRQAGIEVDASFGQDTLKAQLKKADKAEARFALFIGQKEALDETVIIKDRISGSQEVVPLKKIIKEIKKRIKKK